MNTTDQINAILKKRGLSVFRPESIEEEHSRLMLERYFTKTQELFNMVSGQFSSGNVSVTACLTDSLSLDIFVSQLDQKNHYLLGISYGTFANLYACFSGLLAHPDVLPHIGNRHNTHCKYDFVDYGLIDFTYEHKAIRDNTPVAYGFPLWNFPKDEDRILYALLLFDIALQFILYHEWGHIIGGHLSFLNHYQVSAMSENDNKGAPAIPLLIGDDPVRKVIEFEADYIASRILCAQPYYLKITNRTFFQAFPEGFLDKYDIRDAIFFSLLSVFHLLQEIRKKNRKGGSHLYPSMYYRFCSLMYHIYDEDGEASHLWADYDYQGVSDFVKATQELQFSYSFRKYAYNGKATKVALLKLAEQLSQLRKHLAEFRTS